MASPESLNNGNTGGKPEYTLLLVNVTINCYKHLGVKFEDLNISQKFQNKTGVCPEDSYLESQFKHYLSRMGISIELPNMNWMGTLKGLTEGEREDIKGFQYSTEFKEVVGKVKIKYESAPNSQIIILL